MGMDRPLKKKRFPLKLILGIGVLIVTPIVFFYQIRHTEKSPIVYAKRENLRLFQVRRDSFQEYINIIGRVVSARTSYIDTLETGTVKELLVEEGDMLSVGQTVVVLENDHLKTALRLKQSQIEEKELAIKTEQLTGRQHELMMQEELLDIDFKLDAFEKEYRQGKKLYTSTHAISGVEYETIENKYRYWQKKRAVIESQHQLKRRLITQRLTRHQIGLAILHTEKKRLERRFENLIVRVATVGLLTKLEASVGEIKQAGSRIAQYDIVHPLKIEAEIDEYYLTKININYEGHFEVEKPLGKITYYATVSMIHPEVENSVFTIDLKFKEADTTTFIIGQTFDIVLELGRPKNAIVIQKGAFIQDTGGQWVYVVDATKSRAVKRRIKIGRQNPDFLEILEGLDPGEEIILSRYEDYGNAPEITIH